MKNKIQTLRKIVGLLNNSGTDGGGFWLPNIQRPFVWNEDQICRLFDSILREYPISTLLIWKTTSKIRRRKFIENWKPALRLSDFYVPEDDKEKSLVLDGQQRLQSLFIGLCGSFEGRELYLDILSGEIAAPDDVKYRFRFLSGESVAFPWVKFKEIVWSNKNSRQISKEIEAMSHRELDDSELDRLGDNIVLICKTFNQDDAVTYQELDSIDNPELYTEDDVVEVFIRANSGGTKLGKSDLLFSLLSASWEVADEKMEELLTSLNRHGFAFTRDFVLKTCLVLLDQGARYEVPKFRKTGIREKIENQWENISDAIRDVLDFVLSNTYIRCDKALPSYLVLIPLIYVRFHYQEEWKKAVGVDKYLIRSLLAGTFSGNSDSMIDAVVTRIRELRSFSQDEIFGVTRSQGRSLELTEEKFWDMGYNSDTIHLLFNIWYHNFNFTPAFDNNLPQIDHIFPQSLLKQVKSENPKTGIKNIVRYKEVDRNQLANCMLLSREENGPSGKWDIPPEQWFKNKPDSYLELHLIPKNPELWTLDRFEDFIAARRELIRKRFEEILVIQ